MKRSKTILIYTLVVCGFVFSLIINIPAWVMGSTLAHFSQNRISTSNENGSFWHGNALLLAHDETGKKTVPLMMVGWKIKFGLSKFITVNLTASNQTIASASLTKSGIAVNNVDVGLSLDQLTPFLGNMNTLNLSGNVHVNANSLEIGKKMNGSVNVQLSNVGSGISPVNPVGSYAVTMNLASGSLNVSTSDPASVLTVTGDGSLSSLMLNSKVAPEKKDQLLQFMTMMGIPQADGSYQMKVF